MYLRWRNLSPIWSIRLVLLLLQRLSIDVLEELLIVFGIGIREVLLLLHLLTVLRGGAGGFGGVGGVLLLLLLLGC